MCSNVWNESKAEIQPDKEKHTLWKFILCDDNLTANWVHLFGRVSCFYTYSHWSLK